MKTLWAILAIAAVTAFFASQSSDKGSRRFLYGIVWALIAAWVMCWAAYLSNLHPSVI